MLLLGTLLSLLDALPLSFLSSSGLCLLASNTVCLPLCFQLCLVLSGPKNVFKALQTVAMFWEGSLCRYREAVYSPALKTPFTLCKEQQLFVECH